MERTFILSWALILCIPVTTAHGYYYTERASRSHLKEKVTKLHFFFHDIHSGKNPSAVLVAQPNTTHKIDPISPFGSVFAVDNPLTVGPDPKSEVIGNAQGLYVSSGKDKLSLVVYIDFGFTKGKFNGSSFGVFSRNPILDANRELAVIGGRGKFKMARGFAQPKTSWFNRTNGDAVVEYHVNVFHYY